MSQCSMATNVKKNGNDCEDKDFSSSKFGWDSKPRFNLVMLNYGLTEP